MLIDHDEISLVANAQEPGLRDPKRPTHGPQEIWQDFLKSRDLNSTHVLELGPGHFEFCDFVKAHGGRASAVELDPAIAELGRRRGYSVHIHDLRALSSIMLAGGYDGLYGRGSTNPFWCYPDKESLKSVIARMRSLVKPTGWIWVVACPFSSEKLSAAEFNGWLEVERTLYREQGFQEWLLPHKLAAAFYGISVPCAPLYVYTRNLPKHTWSVATLSGLMKLTLKVGARKARKIFLGP